jgi:hypothetical protein
MIRGNAPDWSDSIWLTCCTKGMAVAGCDWNLTYVGCRCPNADVTWNAAVANRSYQLRNYCWLKLFARSVVRAAAATIFPAGLNRHSWAYTVKILYDIGLDNGYKIHISRYIRTSKCNLLAVMSLRKVLHVIETFMWNNTVRRRRKLNALKCQYVHE